MAAVHSRRDEIVWSLVSWVAAIVVALVVGFIVAAVFDGGPSAGIIFAGVTFILGNAILSRYLGPAPDDEATAASPHELAHDHDHAPTPALPPEPVGLVAEAPAAPTPRVSPAPEVAISERVREAARAAGEAARAATQDIAPSVEPARLAAPRAGGPDNLKKIKGVGPKIEELLHGLGFYHFDQIAGWSMAEVGWVDTHLDGFNGRVTRDNWVDQAKVLAAGGETEFSHKVDKGEVY